MQNGEIPSENQLAIYQIAHDQWAHAEQLRWTVLYNFLVANTILLLGWAAVFATKSSTTRTCSLVVFCVAGVCVSLVWLALGIRATGFVRHHAAKATELEARLPSNWRLFGETEEYRRRLKGFEAWITTRHTVTCVPLGFSIMYLVLLWFSSGGSMWHPFSGFSGSITSLVILGGMWCFRRVSKEHTAYNLGPGGNPREYEPIMNRFIRLAEFVIGAATGSIVLIIGSSAFHGQGGRLAWFFASPLILIAASVVYGICYMACQILTYEDVLHGNPHSAGQYALNETLGFSSLLCFILGYIWLVFATTNMA